LPTAEDFAAPTRQKSNLLWREYAARGSAMGTHDTGICLRHEYATSLTSAAYSRQKMLSLNTKLSPTLERNVEKAEGSNSIEFINNFHEATKPNVHEESNENPEQ
jgi:hypothetical protein